MYCHMVSALQWISAASASGAAAFWFLASIVKLPPNQITFETIDCIVPALRKQGVRNAVGAALAALAAAIQALLVLMPHCIE